MRKNKLLTLIGSICLILVFAAMPFMTACPAPAPEVAELEEELAVERAKVAELEEKIAELMLAPPTVVGGVLAKVKDTGVISIGMREAARPFAYIDKKGEHVGFSIDMAYLLVKKLEEYAERDIEIKEVTVTPKTRVPVVVSGAVDIEMGSSTHTAPREDVTDFSLPFFLSETVFMVRIGEGIETLSDLSGLIVSSSRGTTNLKSLREVIDEGVITPKDLVITETHAEGLLALETKKIDAYFTDTSLLMGVKMSAKHPENYEIILESIHAEPYGWIMSEGDSDWRDFVDNFLIWTLQTKAVDQLDTLEGLGILTEVKKPEWSIFDAIYDKWMGPESEVPLPRTPGYDALLVGIQWPDVLEVWPKIKK